MESALPMTPDTYQIITQAISLKIGTIRNMAYPKHSHTLTT